MRREKILVAVVAWQRFFKIGCSYLGAWSQESTPFGYDFWYQPAFDVMVSTQWGAPKAFRKGFSLDDVANSKAHTVSSLTNLH